MPAATFLFDLNSPYAYLAAMRIDELMPGPVQWRPIVFAALLNAQGRTPWSFVAEELAPGIEEISRRARERGLPPVAYPDGWPRASYSISALRAATWALARDQSAGRELVHAMYRTQFVDGRPLSDPAALAAAAGAVGTGPDELEAGLTDQSVKDLLRTRTDEAIAAGVQGVPTVLVGERQFWGDDRLEDAAAAASRER